MSVTRAILVWAAVVAIITPLFAALLGSFTNEAALFSSRPEFDWTLSHYASILGQRDFARPLLNSLLVAGATTSLCVALAAPAGYALTRLSFRGRRLISGLVLLVAMFPQISIVSPLYLLLKRLSLIDTLPGLVLPYLTFAMPLAVWLMSSHFKQLPQGIEEAALLDGASRWVVLKDIVLPVAMPGVVSTALVTFVYAWNEFLSALSFTISADNRTAPVAIALFRGQHQIPWGEILAGAVLTTLPVLALVLVFERRIVRSLTA